MRYIVIMLFAMLLGTTPAIAQKRLGEAANTATAAVVAKFNADVCGGVEGGTYNRVAKEIAAALNTARIDGLFAEAAVTVGAVDNMTLVKANVCSVALTELPVMAMAGASAIVEGWAEVVYLVVPKRLGITTLYDLEKKPLQTIFVGGAGSGGARIAELLREKNQNLLKFTKIDTATPIDDGIFPQLELSTASNGVLIVGAISDKRIAKLAARSAMLDKEKQYQLVEIARKAIGTEGVGSAYKQITLRSDWYLPAEKNKVQQSLYGNMIPQGIVFHGSLDSLATTSNVVFSQGFEDWLAMTGRRSAVIATIQRVIDNNAGATGMNYLK